MAELELRQMLDDNIINGGLLPDEIDGYNVEDFGTRCDDSNGRTSLYLDINEYNEVTGDSRTESFEIIIRKDNRENGHKDW